MRRVLSVMVLPLDKTIFKLPGAAPPGTPQEARRQGYMRLERSGDAEPAVAAPVLGRVPAAARGPDNDWLAVPRAAAQSALVTVPARHPCLAGNRRAIVVTMPAVLHPFPHIPQHIVKAKSVGQKTADRRRVYTPSRQLWTVQPVNRSLAV